MAKPKLSKPIKAIVVGDVDVIAKQIGKYFDDYIQVGREKKYKRQDLDGAQIVCFTTQATAADLKQEWTEYAKDRGLPVMSVRRGAEVPMILESDFVIDDEDDTEDEDNEKVPESLLKAKQAEEEAKNMVEKAQAESKAEPTEEVGIESLDFLSNIKKQVQQKLDKAQQEVDEAMELYVAESERVKDLNQKLAEAHEELKSAEERIDKEIKARLNKAVEKETVKLRTELRRKDKAISDIEKIKSKLEEKTEAAELELVDVKAKLAAAEREEKKKDGDFDTDTVVMTHHLLMLAHAVNYVKPDNKWLLAIWKILQGISEDPEISTIISRFRDAAEVTDKNGKHVLIPPLEDDERKKIKKALQAT